MSEELPGRFRPDIQGLRALAVGLVVLDHARIGPLHGGFVGVDVFFVISGFLITQLLLVEAGRSGRISLLGFYARRARRILPIATLVLAVTVVASYLLLNTTDAGRVLKQSIAAAFFTTNIKFARDETNYFAADDAVSPIQHYWSLAVEEQFYLAWPVIVLLLVWGFSRRGRTPHHLHGAIGITVGVISVASLAWAVHLVASNPLAAYFSTPARAWELGAGAATAAVLHRVGVLGPAVLAGLSWLGVGMIGFASLAYDESTRVPGLPALLPVVGTALLLGAGVEAAKWGPARLLSLAPMRWVGDRSFSLYLWHWPALILVGAAWRDPSGWLGVAVCVAALAVSDLSYRYVENPFRTIGWFKPRLRGLSLYPVSVAALGAFIYVAHLGLVQRYAEPRPAITVSHYGARPGDHAFSSDKRAALVEASVLAAERGVPIPNPLRPGALGLADHVAADLGDCEYYGLPDPMPLCPRGDTEGAKTLVLLGDSHSRHWIPAVERVAEQHGYVAYYFVLQGCTPALVQPFSPQYQAPDETCLGFHDSTQKQITRLKPDLLLMSMAPLARYVGDDGEIVADRREVARMIEKGLVERIESLEPLAQRIAVLGDIPRVDRQPTVIYARGATLEDGLANPQVRSMLNRRAVKAAVDATGVDYVETLQWFCAFDKCPIVVGDFITRRDADHMTLEYAASLAGPLGRALRLGSVS